VKCVIASSEAAKDVKRAKPSATISPPSTSTAIAIPESQKSKAFKKVELQKTRLHQAIEGVLHSQQSGLLPTEIHGQLMDTWGELVSKHSNTAVKQALVRMIDNGEVARTEATTENQRRSHRYILVKPREDRGCKDRAKGSSTQHSATPPTPKPFKVERHHSADLDTRTTKTSRPQAHTSVGAGGSEQLRSAIQLKEKFGNQPQIPEEVDDTGSFLQEASGQNRGQHQTVHPSLPSQSSGSGALVQGTSDKRSMLDCRGSASAPFNKDQHTEPVTEERINDSPDGSDTSHEDDPEAVVIELGQRVIEAQKLRVLCDELDGEKAKIESEKENALTELSESVSLEQETMQEMEALNKELKKLRDKTLELERKKSNFKQQVEKREQIKKLRRLAVEDFEQSVKDISIKQSFNRERLRSLVTTLGIS
jgi:hypothetical protein